MAKIEKIGIEIQTGEKGTDTPVAFLFNGHKLSFETLAGETGAGTRYEGEFEVGSFGHSVVLSGPDAGEWSIDDLRVTYKMEDAEAYCLRFAPLVLDASSDLNIFRPRPRPTFEV